MPVLALGATPEEELLAVSGDGSLIKYARTVLAELTPSCAWAAHAHPYYWRSGIFRAGPVTESPRVAKQRAPNDTKVHTEAAVARTKDGDKNILFDPPHANRVRAFEDAPPGISGLAAQDAPARVPERKAEEPVQRRGVEAQELRRRIDGSLFGVPRVLRDLPWADGKPVAAGKVAQGMLLRHAAARNDAEHSAEQRRPETVGGCALTRPDSYVPM